MRLSDLRELIEQAEDLNLPDETPIKIAEQPNWPFTYKVAGGIIVPEKQGGEMVIYLAESVQEGYLPENVLNTLREEDIW